MVESKNNQIDFNNLEVAFSAKSLRDLKRAKGIFSMMNYPALTESGKVLTKISLKIGLPVSGLIRKTVFNHFCGGVSIDDCDKTIIELDRFNIGTILDYSAEGEHNEEGFEVTKNEILKILQAASKHKAIPFSVFKMSGLASSSLLEKIGSNAKLTNEESQAYERVKGRVNQICKSAFDFGIPIMIDAEETWIQDPIDSIAYNMMEAYNSNEAIVYNTYQMYRSDSLKRLIEAHKNIAGSGLKFGAKLVRGAYMEKERERAQELSYPDPIHVTKKLTDECFDNGLKYCVENISDISVVCGSHNEESNQYLTELMDAKEYPNDHPNCWFSQLYGMSDNISFNLAKRGYNVTKYVPYGPVKSVMPYLFRRAEENTSAKGQSSRELRMIRGEINRRRANQ